MNKNHVNDHKGGKKSDLNSKSISIKNNKVVEKTLRPDKLSTNETTTSSQNFKIEKTSFKSKASLDLYAQFFDAYRSEQYVLALEYLDKIKREEPDNDFLDELRDLIFFTQSEKDEAEEEKEDEEEEIIEENDSSESNSDQG